MKYKECQSQQRVEVIVDECVLSGVSTREKRIVSLPKPKVNVDFLFLDLSLVYRRACSHFDECCSTEITYF